MALIDKGADEEFYSNLAELDDIYANRFEHSGEHLDEFRDAIEWLIQGAHKSDIGVIHRMIREKLRKAK